MSTNTAVSIVPSSPELQVTSNPLPNPPAAFQVTVPAEETPIISPAPTRARKKRGPKKPDVEDTENVQRILDKVQERKSVRLVSVEDILELKSCTIAKLTFLGIPPRYWIGTVVTHEPASVARRYKYAAHGTRVTLRCEKRAWILESVSRVECNGSGQAPAARAFGLSADAIAYLSKSVKLSQRLTSDKLPLLAQMVEALSDASWLTDPMLSELLNSSTVRSWGKAALPVLVAEILKRKVMVPSAT